MKSFHIALISVVLLSGISFGQWTSMGPEGGAIRNVIQNPVCPDSLYAFTDSLPTRVMMSVDGGSSWTQVGSFDNRENCAAIGANGVLYVGCDYTSGRSTDGGATWSFQPASNVLWSSIVPDLFDPDVVYGTGNTYSSNWVMGFMKSEDAGQNWTYQAIGSPITYGECLGVSPVNYDNLFIAGWDGSSLQPILYRSTNGGASWTNVTPPNALSDFYAYSVAVNPGNPDEVLFASSSYIFRSTNNGDSWNTAGSGLPNNWYLAYAPSDSNHVLTACTSSIFYSTNAGMTWSLASSTFPDYMKITDVMYDCSDPDLAFAGSARSLYRSYDGGASWNEAPSGMRNGRIASLHVCPARPTDVYVGLRNWGLYKSEDSGETWNLLATPNPTIRLNYNAVASSPTDADLVLAIDGSYNPGCIIRSTDGGDNWSAVVNRFMIAKDIMFDPLDPNVCWSGGSVYSGGVLMAVGKSVNAGLNWSWTNVSTTGYVMEDLALDPQHPDTVYLCGGTTACTSSGIWRTLDGGTSWTKIPSTDIPGTIYSLVVNPCDPQTIWAASRAGIFRSTDFAANWTKMSTDIGSCRDVMLDPGSPSIVMVGTESQGVYFSEDSGATWSSMSTGIPDSSVYHLAVDPMSYYFAGTDGASVYRWTIPVGVTQQDIATIAPSGMSIDPNPVSASGTVINYEVTVNSPVRLEVYDLQGRLVDTIDEGEHAPGTCQLFWDPVGSSGRPLPSGVYVIRLSVGESVNTARVVVTR